MIRAAFGVWDWVGGRFEQTYSHLFVALQLQDDALLAWLVGGLRAVRPQYSTNSADQGCSRVCVCVGLILVD